VEKVELKSNFDFVQFQPSKGMFFLNIYVCEKVELEFGSNVFNFGTFIFCVLFSFLECGLVRG
jgi:hypothetical protein